jgi:hypothetical protein
MNTPPSHSQTDAERRASICRECGDVRGNPVTNLIAPGVQTITYRCPSCGFTWKHARPTKTEPLLTP